MGRSAPATSLDFTLTSSLLSHFSLSSIVIKCLRSPVWWPDSVLLLSAMSLTGQTFPAACSLSSAHLCDSQARPGQASGASQSHSPSYRAPPTGSWCSHTWHAWPLPGHVRLYDWRYEQSLDCGMSSPQGNLELFSPLFSRLRYH